MKMCHEQSHLEIVHEHLFIKLSSWKFVTNSNTKLYTKDQAGERDRLILDQ